MPRGERTKYRSHSLHQREPCVWLCPGLKTFWCPEPYCMLASCARVRKRKRTHAHQWITYSLACILLVCDVRPWISGYFACGLWTPSEECETVNRCVFPCAVSFLPHSSLPCLFGGLLLILQNLAQTPLSPRNWGTPSDFQKLLHIPLLQPLPLCFNCYFKSLLCPSGVWVTWEQGPRFISGLNSVLSTGPGIEQVVFKFQEWMID